MNSMRRGFTLAEMLVVIAIIGLIASVSYVQYQEARKQARDERRQIDLQQIAVALRLYYEQNGGYPCQAGGGPECDGLLTGANGEIGEGGDIDEALAPYLEYVPADPLAALTEYSYYYDGASCGGQDSAIVFAINMEVPENADRKDCNGGQGGLNDNSYIVILGKDTN